MDIGGQVEQLVTGAVAITFWAIFVYCHVPFYSILFIYLCQLHLFLIERIIGSYWKKPVFVKNI